MITCVITIEEMAPNHVGVHMRPSDQTKGTPHERRVAGYLDVALKAWMEMAAVGSDSSSMIESRSIDVVENAIKEAIRRAKEGE